MEDIDEFLKSLGLEQYLPALLDNHIDLEMLVDLENEEFAELGIRSIGHRRQIRAAAAAYNAGPKTSASEWVDRREVTVLFADVTDYTALAQSLETEVLHGIMSDFFESVDAAVIRLGGSVERHVGDCIMAVFGAPKSHGNDAERAVLCAESIHELMEDLSARYQQTLTVHVGIASGNVIYARHGYGTRKAVEASITGETVNLAARLADMAAARETVLGLQTARALGAKILCDALENVEIKGFDTPQPTFRLRGFQTDVERPGFVGRAHELNLARTALKSCRQNGEGSALILCAEAGMGKTRLAERILELGSDMGFAVHCIQFNDVGPAKTEPTLKRILEQLLGFSDTRSLAVRAKTIDKLVADGAISLTGALLLRHMFNLPIDGHSRILLDVMSDGSLAASYVQLLDSILGLVCTTPRVLLVEDVHWATPEDVALLDTICSLVRRRAIVLLITSRPDAKGRAFSPTPRKPPVPCQTIELAPLTPEDALHLANSLSGPKAAGIEKFVARADGHPLFLLQLIHHGLASNMRSETDMVPGSVQSLVQARFDGLPLPHQRILQVGAVLGQRFKMQDVAEIIGDPAVLACDIEEASLVNRVSEGHEFVHALVRDAIRMTILRDKLRDLHVRAARCVMRRSLGMHAWHLAQAKDKMAGAAYAEASIEAAARFERQSALRYCDLGLKLENGPETHDVLLHLKGTLLRELGQAEASIEVFQRAEAVANDPCAQTRALIGQVSGMRITDQFDLAFEALDRAQALATAHDLRQELCEVHILRGNLFFPGGKLDACQREQEMALNVLKTFDAPELEARALSGLGDAHYAVGRIATAHAVFSKCLTVCAQNELVGIESANRFMLATTAIYANDTQQALQDALKSADLAAQVGQARAEIVSRLTAAWVLISMAEYALADEQIKLGLARAAEHGMRRFEPFLQEAQARVELVCGTPQTALQIIRAAADDVRASSAVPFIGPWLLATLALCSGTRAEADAALQEGQTLLQGACVGHNHLRFHQIAGDTYLRAARWQEASAQASQLDAFSVRIERTAWSDFHVRRLRCLADYGEGYSKKDELEALIAQARDASLFAFLPPLEEALVGVPLFSSPSSP